MPALNNPRHQGKREKVENAEVGRMAYSVKQQSGHDRDVLSRSWRLRFPNCNDRQTRRGGHVRDATRA